MLNTAADLADIATPSLNTKVASHIRVVNGVLDDDPNVPGGLVLHGRIDPSTLRFLKVDSDYQRPLSDRRDIFDALKSGTVVPDIEIGVRGQDFESDGDDILVMSPAYIIDGWQRIGTALRILDNEPNHPLRMFGTFHFGTDAIWERHRFTALNRNIRTVSPNLHLRNMRDSNDAVLTLYGLSNNTRDFPLYRKVSWSQNMKRGDLVPATQLARSSAILHMHLSGNSAAAASPAKVALALSQAAHAATLPIFRRNVTTFFTVIDECWNIRDIEYRSAAPQIKGAFMSELARVFSHHPDFWDSGDRILQVNKGWRRKLASFAIRDPQVVHLAGSGGSSRKLLYQLLVEHMNSGKRTHRLQSRFDR